jgi:hypothetical protein
MHAGDSAVPLCVIPSVSASRCGAPSWPWTGSRSAPRRSGAASGTAPHTGRASSSSILTIDNGFPSPQSPADQPRICSAGRQRLPATPAPFGRRANRRNQLVVGRRRPGPALEPGPAATRGALPCLHHGDLPESHTRRRRGSMTGRAGDTCGRIASGREDMPQRGRAPTTGTSGPGGAPDRLVNHLPAVLA